MRELIEITGREVVDAAYRVHRELGPGLLESAYQQFLAHDLRIHDHEVECEVNLSVEYLGLVVDAGYRIDMIVDNRVLIENKCVKEILPVHEAQLLTYLKLSHHRLGFLINWHVPLIKDGIRRKVLRL